MEILFLYEKLEPNDCNSVWYLMLTFIHHPCGSCQPITKNLERHLISLLILSSSFLAIILVLCMVLHINIPYNYGCASDLIKLLTLQVRRHNIDDLFPFVFFYDLNLMLPWLIILNSDFRLLIFGTLPCFLQHPEIVLLDVQQLQLWNDLT